MSKLKSILKWLIIIVVLLGIVLFGAVKFLSKERPAAIPGENADALAQDMLSAMNKPAWDTLRYLTWEFRGGHKYLWDKKENNAVVEWENNKVVIDLDKVDGIALKNGKEVDEKTRVELIQKAWSFWCNDSFWMFAPFKVFDPGTSRVVVKTDKGKKGLMVSYDSGGVTPGDAYLWILDENNIPTGYEMWTSIIPVKGMYMSWEDWVTLKGGAKVSRSHKSSVLTLDMKGVQEGDSVSELGYPDNVFDF